MSHLEEIEEQINAVDETVDEPIEDDVELNQLEKPKKIKRGRKPMSEAQKQVLKAGREKAKLNQQRRLLKEREDKMRADGMLEPAHVSDDEEVKVVVRRKPRPKSKPKPKKKKIVYVEESSSDEGADESSEDEIVYRKPRRRQPPMPPPPPPPPPANARPILVFK